MDIGEFVICAAVGVWLGTILYDWLFVPPADKEWY